MILTVWYIERNKKLLNNSAYLIVDSSKVSELFRIASGYTWKPDIKLKDTLVGWLVVFVFII